MKLTVGTVTDRGLNPKRSANEDRFLVLPERGLFLVADGVGGRRGGQVASQTVVDVFEKAFAKPPRVDLSVAIQAAVIEANRQIFANSVAHAELDGMATTVAVVAIQGDEAVVAHVGDSRVYRFQDASLLRETEDHSEVNEAVRAGMISAAMALYDPLRNVITRALGAEPDVEADFKTIALSPDVRFLICSDGITRHINDRALQQVLSQDLHPEDVCAILKQRCFELGAEDNLTAVVVDTGNRRYRELDSSESGISNTPTSSSRIQVDLRAPTSARDASATIESAQTADSRSPEQSSGESSSSKRARGFLLILALVLSGVAIGRYYDSIREWVVAKVGTAFIPEPSPSNSPAPDPGLAAARVLFDDKRFDKARDQLTALVRRSPEKAEYHFWLGRTDYELKSFPDAIKNLNEAARLDPQFPDVYVHLARAYEAVGDRRNMEESLRRANPR